MSSYTAKVASNSALHAIGMCPSVYETASAAIYNAERLVIDESSGMGQPLNLFLKLHVHTEQS